MNQKKTFFFRFSSTIRLLPNFYAVQYENMHCWCPCTQKVTHFVQIIKCCQIWGLHRYVERFKQHIRFPYITSQAIRIKTLKVEKMFEMTFFALHRLIKFLLLLISAGTRNSLRRRSCRFPYGVSYSFSFRWHRE